MKNLHRYRFWLISILIIHAMAYLNFNKTEEHRGKQSVLESSLEEKEKKAISQILDSDFKNFIEKQQKGAKSSVRVRLTNKKQNLRYQKDLEKKSKMSNCGKDFYGGVGITHSGFFSPVVSEVAKGYAADRAGVKIGDVILGFFEHSDLTKFIEGPTIKGKEGTGIDLYVKRNEKVIKFSIVREKICYEKNKP